MSARIAVPVLVALACMLAACGSGSGPEPTPADAVRGYIDAVAAGRGHGAEVCGHLTGAALQYRGGANCAARVERQARRTTAATAAAIKSLKLELASEHGKTATVKVFVPQAACPGAKVQKIQLVKKDGAWLISRTDDFACAPTS